MDLSKLGGKLIVVEGADGSGRSTQIARLVEWLEGCGHATVQVGLKRSTLVSEELDKAQQGNILSHTTLSLFYATDFADQLENIILPGLRAGRMVLADRYIYTLMVRDMVRGMDLAWLKTSTASPWCRTWSSTWTSCPKPWSSAPSPRTGPRLLGKRHGPGPVPRYV